MKNKFKVLHVIPSVSPSRGGPSKAIIEMVGALKQEGIDAEIATTNDHGTVELDVPLNIRTQYRNVPVYFFKRFSPPINSVREFAYSRNFQQWIKKHIDDYDVIHVHAIFSFCSTYTMHLARKKNIPYIVRPIGQLESWSLKQSYKRKKHYLNIIERSNLNNANSVHFTAESERQQSLATLPKLKGVVIPLGINVPQKIPDAKQKMIKHWGLKGTVPTLVFLSRLHPKKGLERLLTSLSELDEFPFQLLIAGDGDSRYKQSLKDLVSSLTLSQQCHFIGFVEGDEKELLLQGGDLFTLTSHSENFGIAALEAMASGTAILVSNEVALSDVINENKLGFVTDLTVKGITDTLKMALTGLNPTSNDTLTKSDVSRTQTMGNNARDLVKKHYQWSNISQQLITLYNSIKAH